MPPRPAVYSEPVPRPRCGQRVPAAGCGLPVDRGGSAPPPPKRRTAAPPAAL